MIPKDLGVNIEAIIKEGTTEIFLTENKKRLPPKSVSTSKFIQALSSIKLDEVGDETPLLPSNYGTKKMMKKGNRDYYLMVTTPPGVKTIKYGRYYLDSFRAEEEDYYEYLESHSDEYEVKEIVDDLLTSAGFESEEIENDFDVYAPSMVWFIHLKEKEDEGGLYFLSHCKVFAKDSVVLSMEDSIYHAPFGNVYDDNNICWGSVDVPDLTIQGAMAVDRLFFSNYFDTDLEQTVHNPVYIDGYNFNGKLLNLILNNQVLKDDGEDAARDNMHNMIRKTKEYNLGSVWNDFTR